MNGAVLLILASVCFLLGYRFYAKMIERKLGIDPSIPTPAHTKKDGVDFIPAHPTVLFGHHFAAIAGAGPIVGPVLAAEFGWASVALWIVLGCIFIGAAHDMISLFLSIRHGGESIGTVIGTILGKPGKILFLLFSWSALVLVVAEFTRQITGTSPIPRSRRHRFSSSPRRSSSASASTRSRCPFSGPRSSSCRSCSPLSGSATSSRSTS